MTVLFFRCIACRKKKRRFDKLSMSG